MGVGTLRLVFGGAGGGAQPNRLWVALEGRGGEPSWQRVLSAPSLGCPGLSQGSRLGGACVPGLALASCLRGEVRDPALGIFHDLPSRHCWVTKGWLGLSLTSLLLPWARL